MTRVLSCILWLITGGFGLMATGCGSDGTEPCATAVETDEIEPLKFENGVWVYLTSTTSADAVALERSGGEKTFFIDPDGNEWLLTSESGFVAYDFMKKDYTEDWFAVEGRATGQRYYCLYIPKPYIPPYEDALLIDEPSRCSVYLDAGHLFYARLERTADAVPCPTVAEYRLWLPHAIAHAIPLQIP